MLYSDFILKIIVGGLLKDFVLRFRPWRLSEVFRPDPFADSLLGFLGSLFLSATSHSSYTFTTDNVTNPFSVQFIKKSSVTVKLTTEAYEF